MANTTTLAQLRTRSRERADMEDSDFVSTTEELSYINASYAELYDILVSRFEDYFTINTEITVASGDSSFPLPTTFYKLRALDLRLDSSGNNWTALPKFNFNNRNIRNSNVSRLLSGQFNISYSVVGANVELVPTDSALGTYRLWYVPIYTPLADESDTIDGISGWEEYIVIDVAIKMLNKEESSVTHLVKEKEAMLKRIEDMANNRDVDQPEVVGDVTDLYYDPDTLYIR